MSINSNDARFDQFTDFKTVDEVLKRKSRIIFSKKAYKHFLELIISSFKSKHETGVFFLGKEQGKNSNEIFIDSFTTDLKSSDGNYEGGAVGDTPESQAERKKAVTECGYDCLFHFHVHTAPDMSYYDVFSDQDLKLYATYNESPYFQYYSKQDIENISGTKISSKEYDIILQQFLDGKGKMNEAVTKVVPQNRKVTYFGILATPDRTNPRNQSRTIHNNYQLSTVFPELHYDINGELKTHFYRFPNMYYIGDQDIIYRIGDFQRKESPELSNGRRVNNNNVRIQAVGKDPNTGNIIQPVEVGKYEDGQFKFDKERSTTDLSNLTRDTGER